MNASQMGASTYSDIIPNVEDELDCILIYSKNLYFLILILF